MVTVISSSSNATVLVINADDSMRRLLRLGLEMDGIDVVEAGSVSEVKNLLQHGDLPAVSGIVLECDLPDGEGADLVPDLERHFLGAPVALLTDNGASRNQPSSVKAVPRGDLVALSQALALPGRSFIDNPHTAIDILRQHADDVAADWAELCRWDPSLPPDSSPPIAAQMVTALSNALERPQPLGWGPDPEVETIAEDFARAVGALDVAIGQLVCLREVLRRRLVPSVPPDELPETLSRMHMVVDRSLQVVATHMAGRLEQEAMVDPLTGLLNRRALERDVRREKARAARYGRKFSVMVIDVDGLKQVNDSEGHLAGDLYLRSLAQSLSEVLRSGDEAYRIGGDEFVIVLPETGEARAAAVAERIEVSGAPPFSWGAATFNEDGEDLDELIGAADRRLYERRALVRSRRA